MTEEQLKQFIAELVNEALEEKETSSNKPANKDSEPDPQVSDIDMTKTEETNPEADNRDKGKSIGQMIASIFKGGDSSKEEEENTKESPLDNYERVEVDGFGNILIEKDKVETLEAALSQLVDSKASAKVEEVLNASKHTPESSDKVDDDKTAFLNEIDSML